MCQPGYIEVDGNCVYEFGGSTLPDGTPKAPGNDGDKKPFCDTPLGKYVCDAVPVILVGGAGWFENKYGDKPEPTKPNSTPKTPAKPAEKNRDAGLGLDRHRFGRGSRGRGIGTPEVTNIILLI